MKTFPIRPAFYPFLSVTRLRTDSLSNNRGNASRARHKRSERSRHMIFIRTKYATLLFVIICICIFKRLSLYIHTNTILMPENHLENGGRGVTQTEVADLTRGMRFNSCPRFTANGKLYAYMTATGVFEFQSDCHVHTGHTYMNVSHKRIAGSTQKWHGDNQLASHPSKAFRNR